MVFVFGDHVLDVDRRELRRRGGRIALEPQVFDLLVYLVRNRDRVVSKDDLLETIWGGRIVSESTITSRINAVRKAVGDSGEAQLSIRTVPRKGIRFICRVQEERGNPTVVAPWQEPDLSSPDIPLIAVLPFRNLRPDPVGLFFSRGMMEDIVVSLTGLHELLVISSGSTVAYRDKEADPRDVGRVLGARYLVGGSVSRSGKRLRVSCELCDARSGRNIWAERVETTLGDIFDIQDHLVERFVAHIAPHVRKEEVTRALCTHGLRLYLASARSVLSN
jgi:TolB-like protein